MVKYRELLFGKCLKHVGKKAIYARDYGKILACYACKAPGKGDYSGNRLMLEQLWALPLSNSEELEHLLTEAVVRKTEEKQLSLFNFFPEEEYRC